MLAHVKQMLAEKQANIEYMVMQTVQQMKEEDVVRCRTVGFQDSHTPVILPQRNRHTNDNTGILLWRVCYSAATEGPRNNMYNNNNGGPGNMKYEIIQQSQVVQEVSPFYQGIYWEASLFLRTPFTEVRGS